MKLLTITLLLALLVGCVRESVAPAAPCTLQLPGNTYPKAGQLQQIIDRYTAVEGLPGIAVAVISPEGSWTGAAGFARLEDRTPMQPCHLQFGQSVAKTYMATVILQLLEAGKLELDAPITRYLPERLHAKISRADQLTVRMLLNHTSGVADYASDTRYVAYLLQHPLQRFTGEEYLDYIDGKPLAFEPGSYHDYSNTNYLLLALMADHLSGNHTQLIQKGILTPLALQQTIYHDTQDFQQRPDVVNSYFDRFGNGKLENVSDWQRANVASMIGDDGILATPVDYVRFLQGLFAGKLVSERSLKLMTTWTADKNGKPTYGMGLFREEYKGHVAYGHGGAGVGAGCTLYYFPDRQLYFFLGTNMGTLTEGPLVRKTEALRDAVLDVLLK